MSLPPLEPDSPNPEREISQNVHRVPLNIQVKSDLLTNGTQKHKELKTFFSI